MAEDITDEALQVMIINSQRGSFNFVAIKAPGYNDYREYLQDIAAITGATLISQAEGTRLEQADLSMLGSAEKVIVSKETTTIFKGIGDKKALQDRADQINAYLKEEGLMDYQILRYKTRLAKLIGGIAVLYVGGATESEVKEVSDRIDDALHATRAAVEEGIVPGGGVALIRAAEAIDSLKVENEDQATGVNIVRMALEAPLRTIVSNAGGEPSVVVNKVKEQDGNFGYNARTDVYEDLVESGVIDPVKVTRLALENGASVAGLILTTECAIDDIQK